MSPSDLARIQPVAPGRKVARELADPSAKSSGGPAAAQSDDRAVKVETGASVDPGQPPIDQSRVDAIRKAVQHGNYPIYPTKIADAMIAAPLLLSAPR